MQVCQFQLAHCHGLQAHLHETEPALVIILPHAVPTLPSQNVELLTAGKIKNKTEV